MTLGIEYYAFALFVTAMICIIAILFKMLFADVRRQKKMLDEKESELLKLFRTVENMMEEFADQVKSTTREIKIHEDKIMKLRVKAQKQSVEQRIQEQAAPEQTEQLPRRMTVDSSSDRIKIASDLVERQGRVIKGDLINPNTPNTRKPEFQQIFTQAENEIQTIDATKNAKKARTDKVMALSKQGKTAPEIAKELGITQNEVRLIIELGKQGGDQ